MARTRKFKAGQRWSDNFDYCGMLEAGKKAKISDGAKELRKLFDSFEDVNYHSESAPLWDALHLLEDDKKKQAQLKLKKFNRVCEKTKKEFC
jgi:hypothetical protein